MQSGRRGKPGTAQRRNKGTKDTQRKAVLRGGPALQYGRRRDQGRRKNAWLRCRGCWLLQRQATASA